MKNKLNQLTLALPEGAVVGAKWLRNQGYSASLVTQYVKNSWLNSISRGVYRRPGRLPQWQDAVVSASHFGGLELHVGGLTSLQLQGFAHYIPMTEKPDVVLYVSNVQKTNVWFNKLDLAATLKIWPNTLFLKNVSQEYIQDWDWPKLPWPLHVSVIERAMLELVSLVPKTVTVEHASRIMEGATLLRPDRLTELLLACNNIRTKRLFLYLAEKTGLPWFEKLKIESVNLGKGKRVIEKGGHLDSKYQIVVQEQHIGA